LQGETPLTSERAAALRRKQLVERLSKELSSRAYPRLAMLTFVAVAGTAGFVASAAMLAYGMTTPAARYPIAVVAGYLAFLGMIRLWLAFRRREVSGDLDLSALDLVPIDSPAPFSFGGGGGFSGGGSSAAFPADAGAAAVEAKSSLLEGGLSAAAEADEGAIVLIPIVVGAAILVSLLASGAVLYNAPVLLADVLLDSAIATVAYRRLRQHQTMHWTGGVVRRTWKPMLAITLALLALGVAIPMLKPGADSIGDLFR